MLRFAALLATAGFILAMTGPVTAKEGNAPADLPVTRVILSTSGMAYFEHEAEVSGNARVGIPARLDQVDDMLKSLVVFDEKGQLGAVTLPGRQPLEQAFRDLPFTQGDIQSPVQLLNALEGAQVKVSGALNAEGMIVQVIPETVVIGNTGNVVQKHRITLMTVEGLKQAIFEDLDSVQFVDARLRDQLNFALSSVHEHSTKDRRTLSVDLKGSGARDVALAYVVDAPLWKAAYRFVLPEDSEKGFVQGWAVVENMTGSDWKNVDLSLVSGNPVTYRQELYQSYRVQRPELPVEVLGHVMPRVDTGVVEEAARDESGGMMMEMKKENRAMKSRAAPAADMAMAPSAVGGMMAMEAAAPPPRPMSYTMAQMANAAASSDATAQVLFRFKNRFNLAAGDSMMLPFLSRPLPMEKLWLYQPETHDRHPLAAVMIRNESDSGLPPGIATLYQQDKTLGGTSFVGDAQMPVLARGEDRLVPYALDAKTLIDREFRNDQVEGKISISKGVMRTAVKYRNETVYTIKAPAEEARMVMIEHPKMPGYEIVQPEKEKTDVTGAHYRIRVPVRAGGTEKVSVVLEQDAWQSYEIRSFSLPDFQAYATTRGKLDDKTRKMFEKLAALRAELDTVSNEIQRKEMERQRIYEDQNRLRENIRSLPGDSDLRKRYLDRLNEQETALEKIEETVRKLNEDLSKKQKALDDFILGIEL